MYSVSSADITPSEISWFLFVLYSSSLAAIKYPLPPAAPCLFTITILLIPLGSDIGVGIGRLASRINFSFISLSDSHLRIHLLPKTGVFIDSISSEVICAISVPCGISTDSFCANND